MRQVVNDVCGKCLDAFKYLVMLRDSGETNMFGATPYLEDAFDMSHQEAKNTLLGWMKSFDLPEDEQPKDGREGMKDIMEAYVCDGCGVSAEDALGEYDGTEAFYCVECQWEDEHNTFDENCKCYS